MNIIINVESVWHSELNAKFKSYSDESEWKVSDNRFVAFLDILGFKRLVEEESHTEILKLFEFITQKKDIVNNGKDDAIKPINIVAFSDSIVIFSKDDKPETVDIFLYAVGWIFSEIIKEGTPIKGGFSHGLMTADFKKEIFFGMPLIEAYQTEGVTHFIVAHESIAIYLNDSENKFEDILFNQNVFIKDKDNSVNEERLTLNTYPFFVIDENKKFPEIMNMMKDTIYKSNSLKIYDQYKK